MKTSKGKAPEILKYFEKCYFVIICFMLLCCLSGCGEPKQTTKPGDFGHYIYKEFRTYAQWRIIGMYLNDSLIVMGDPQCPDYKYPIFNKNSGKIVDYYEVSKK